MPRNTEKGSFKEHQPIPYSLASTYKTYEESEQPFHRAQEIIDTPTGDLELSASRFERKPRDPRTTPLERPWFVAVVGQRPPEPIEHQLLETLRSGEMTTLPLETVGTLAQRRAQETKKAPWVEGHYGRTGITLQEVNSNMRHIPFIPDQPFNKNHRVLAA